MSRKKTLPEVTAINKEIKRLTNIIKDLDENKKALAVGPIEELAFMKVTLKKLKDIVNEEGVIDEMDQGGYVILRSHPALKSYNDMVPKYNATKQLIINLFPKEIAKIINDGFEEFVINRD